MKNFEYIITLATILNVSGAGAMVRTLNKNNPSPGQFTTWAAAQTAAVNGDIIYVSGASTSYGNITISKQLTIMGTGHNPQNQNPLVSEFDSVIYNTPVFNLNGIKVQTIIGIYSAGAVNARIENYYISSICYITLNSSGNTYSWVIKNNIFKSNGSSYLENNIHILSTTILGNTSFFQGDIQNNIFSANGAYCISAEGSGSFADGYGGVYYGVKMKNSVIKNNLFIGDVASTVAIAEYLENSTIQNNILYNCSALVTTQVSNTQSYNCAYPSTNAFATNNSGNNIYANPLFVNAPGYPFQLTYNYNLQSSSPCIGTGISGEVMGVFGGPYGSMFSMYGEPSIPQLKQMNMPATVISGQSFNVNIISTVK